jgi:hypothetical protein
MAQGSVQLFGFTLASASIAFGLEGSTGRVYITPRIVLDLLFTKVDVSTTFNLFYIKIPKPIYLAGNANDTVGTGFNRGTLYLNIGSRAGMRNMSEDDVNEGFVLTKIAADPDYPGEIIRVEAFGRSQTFRGVTAISADAGTGFDYISIGPGILAPVTLIGGDRRDWLLHYGSGNAIIDGGTDDDELHGGTGTNTFRFGNAFGRDAISSESMVPLLQITSPWPRPEATVWSATVSSSTVAKRWWSQTGITPKLSCSRTTVSPQEIQSRFQVPTIQNSMAHLLFCQLQPMSLLSTHPIISFHRRVAH